jgi:cellulose synthase (UDP-forming)
MFKSVWTKKQIFTLKVLRTLWLASVIGFGIWWLQPSHIGNTLGYILNTLVVAWFLLLPAYCFYFLLKMKRTDHSKISIPQAKVAMIVTKAPNEPFDVIRNTLSAMIAQKTPHDNWVADEDPSEEALKWYTENNIFVSCRKNIADYHNATWPRRTKCKEGNLAYFYDKYGYERYDLVVQMDADHAPQEGYLEHMIAPFTDPKVGYVAAPSINDTNTQNSWAARARLQSEAAVHGPIQAGTNDGWTPICIGSHYAVRTEALKQIGGLGPELAEDYSTTLLMKSNGWSGVWAYDAHARGEGANSFKDLITQDYQWARSLVTLLFSFYPKHWKNLKLKEKVQFTFTQLYYPLGAFMWLASILIPITALITNETPVKVEFTDFLFFSSIPSVISLSIFAYVLKTGNLRPGKVKLIGWENGIFELTRWPWILVACVDAIISLITKRNHIFRVTSKGKASSVEMALFTVSPYLFVGSLALLISIIYNNNTDLIGYQLFTQFISFIYLSITIIIMMLHLKEAIYENTYKLALKHTPQLLLPLAFLATLSINISQQIPIYQNTLVLSEQRSESPKTVKVNTEVLSSEKESSVNNELSNEFYTVKTNENLWIIAEKFYGDGRLWTKIKTPNNSKVIHQGEVVEITS